MITFAQSIANEEDDITIIRQLRNGNHLEPRELERADKLLYLLKLELERRIK